jgi:acyl transferase domain-containing protein
MSGHHLCVDQNAYTISTDSQPASRPTTPLTPLSWEDLDTGHTQSLPKLLAWSASDEKGTHRLTQAFEQHFSKQSAEIFTPFTLDSLAYTLGERRTALPTRSFAVVDCQSDLSRLSKLASLPIKDRRPRKTCFVFTGQGAQYSQMGLQLLQYSVFRRSIEDADACMRALGCEWSLIGKYILALP